MNSSTEIEKERHEAVEQSDWNTAYGENNVYLRRVKYWDIVPRGIMQGGVFTVMASIVASLFLDSPTGENFYDLWTLPSSVTAHGVGFRISTSADFSRHEVKTSADVAETATNARILRSFAAVKPTP